MILFLCKRRIYIPLYVISVIGFELIPLVKMLSFQCGLHLREVYLVALVIFNSAVENFTVTCTESIPLSSLLECVGNGVNHKCNGFRKKRDIVDVSKGNLALYTLPVESVGTPPFANNSFKCPNFGLKTYKPSVCTKADDALSGQYYTAGSSTILLSVERK